MRRKKIEVGVDVEEEAARELIREFACWITRGIPYVIVKEAMTLDGKIATRTGDSRWVSGAPARRWAHALRRRVDAIAVGRKTALKDNPRLTARGAGGNGHQPLRVVLDSRARTPVAAAVLAVVATLACGVPALKASRLDPAVTLRSE